MTKAHPSTEEQLTVDDLKKAFCAALRWMADGVREDIKDDEDAFNDQWCKAYKRDLRVMRDVYRRMKL